jgi:hypothetical protein
MNERMEECMNKYVFQLSGVKQNKSRIRTFPKAPMPKFFPRINWPIWTGARSMVVDVVVVDVVVVDVVDVVVDVDKWRQTCIDTTAPPKVMPTIVGRDLLFLRLFHVESDIFMFQGIASAWKYL